MTLGESKHEIAVKARLLQNYTLVNNIDNQLIGLLRKSTIKPVRVHSGYQLECPTPTRRCVPFCQFVAQLRGCFKVLLDSIH